MKEMQAQISEVFLSLEGEGPFIGRPMLFVRFFGCNLTCPGFNSTGQAPEYLPADHVDSVVVATTGCDSAYSWHPTYKNLRTSYTVSQLIEEIKKHLPEGDDGQRTFQYPTGTDIVLCFTGGEPLMWQPFIQSLMEHGNFPEVDNVLFETNATKPWAMNHHNWKWSPDVHLSLSPKLANSGETTARRYVPKAVKSYLNHLHRTDYDEDDSAISAYFKFVSNGSDDSVSDALAWLDCMANDIEASYYSLPNGIVKYENPTYVDERVERFKRIPVYLMPEGVTAEQCHAVQRKVAEQCVKHGFNFTPRLHLDLWGHTTGT